jgi:hypothetical protein
MGSPISADDHTFEVIREYSHHARVKKTDILRELVKPLEKKLANEFGIRIVDGQPMAVEMTTESSSSKRKVRAAK